MDEPQPAASSSTPHPPRRSFPRGCQSILWALLIIAVLIAIAFYNFAGQIEESRQKENEIMTKTIENAIVMFDSDYQTLPLPSGPLPEGGDRDTDTSPAHGFTSILLGMEGRGPAGQNPRNTNYGEGIKPAKSNPAWDSDFPWKNGLLFDRATGACGIVDSSGKPYRIRLDTNHDQQLANPDPDQAAAGRPNLPKQVIVWGAGKDGDWNTWDDNPKSWE